MSQPPKYTLMLTADEAAALVAFLTLCAGQEASAISYALLDVMDAEDSNKYDSYPSPFGCLDLCPADREV